MATMYIINIPSHMQGGIYVIPWLRLIVQHMPNPSAPGSAGRERGMKEGGGEDFDIIALNDTAMARWRHDALSPDAPWAPTLVEVTEQGCT